MLGRYVVFNVSSYVIHRIIQDLNGEWQYKNTVRSLNQLSQFAVPLLPLHLPQTKENRSMGCPGQEHKKAPETAIELLEDVKLGMERAPMAVKLTPHVLSLINWSDPLNDPLFRQFIPLGSRSQPDHPKLFLDSLDETADSPVKGFIHRYPDKGVFLGTYLGIWLKYELSGGTDHDHSELGMSCVLSFLYAVLRSRYRNQCC